MAAAMMADEERGAAGIYNLDGGIRAWDGGIAEQSPAFRFFERQAEACSWSLYMTAMNLEKGAINFYTTIEGTLWR